MMIERHLGRLRARDAISDAEESAIRSSVIQRKQAFAGSVITAAGVEQSCSTLLLEGLVSRTKVLPDGSRQITQLHVAGDFIDLQSFSLKVLDHDLVALSNCAVAVVSHAALRRITEEHPHLTRVYWFLTSLDAAANREWEVWLGQRSALARVASLFCELNIRLGLVGLNDANGFDLPLTQTDLGDCLGLTSVHINRTLRELRERGVVTFRSGRVLIQDWAGLRDAAQYDPSYLYLDRRVDR
jgi:CRP-like cAMP-binding protein